MYDGSNAPDLSGSHTVLVRVAADASTGAPARAATTLTFTPNPTAPGAPTQVSAVAGNGQATVSFTAPVDDGGSPITGYEITVLTGNVSGFDDGTFRPNEKITREQAMMIIAKAMAVTELQGVTPGHNANSVLQAFTDAESVSSWALNGAADSISAGIISGRTHTVLAPKSFITRAEVAVMIQRLLQNSDLINK